jgi:hypothetical protein
MTPLGGFVTLFDFRIAAVREGRQRVDLRHPQRFGFRIGNTCYLSIRALREGSKRMTILRIVKLGTSSLRNHIVFIFVVVSLPTAAVFAVSSYQDNELTPAWMLRIFVVTALGGLFVALVGWFIILPPILRRSGRKND